MKVPTVEYHIVYREGPEVTVARRGYQQVHVPRLAVFSTYDEARLYMQMVAMMDRHIYGKGKNGSYCVRALPFDLTPDQFEPILEDFSAGWKRDFDPHYSLFAYPFRFDGFGQKKFEAYPLVFDGFDTRVGIAYSEKICAELTPDFKCGDLVLLRGWDYRPDTYAVVTTLGTQGGLVQKLEAADVWNGLYGFVFMCESGILDSDYAHVALDFEMLPVGDNLPPKYRILRLLSRHYTGEAPIPGDLYVRLTEELVLAEDIDAFPFGLFEEFDITVHPPYRSKVMEEVKALPEASKRVMHIEKGLPELQTVFVVIAMEMDYSLGQDLVEAFGLRESPAMFSSFQKAKEFLLFLCAQVRDDDTNPGWEIMQQRFLDRLPLDVEPSLPYSSNVMVQIVELLMPCETITDEELVQSLAFEDLVRHTWCYNVDGALLWESPAPERAHFERYPFEGRHKVGDLVYVVPQTIDPESESIMGGVAVVSEVPVSKEAWLASGEEPASWNPFYTVDFVDGNYYLQHFHVPESSLLLADFPVCEYQAFLPLWSRHLRGELDFPEGLADRIRARKMLLRKCPRYDFATGKIVE